MTNNLTNDTSRLCGEIAALRASRSLLLGSLTESRAQMQAAVHQMLQGFGAARSEIAAQTTADLGAVVARVKEAVTGLRQSVAGMQEEFREDLAGARRAWDGSSARTRPSSAAAKPSFRAGETSDDLTPKARRKKR